MNEIYVFEAINKSTKVLTPQDTYDRLGLKISYTNKTKIFFIIEDNCLSVRSEFKDYFPNNLVCKYVFSKGLQDLLFIGLEY